MVVRSGWYRMRLITIQQASEELGLSIASLHGTNANKYQRFRVKTEDSRVIMFDIDGFLKWQGLKESLKEKSKLLVEYLHFICDMPYSKIAQLAKTNVTTVQALNYGYEIALRIVRQIAYIFPFHLIRFDEYYSWKPAPRITRKAIA